MSEFKQQMLSHSPLGVGPFYNRFIKLYLLVECLPEIRGLMRAPLEAPLHRVVEPGLPETSGLMYRPQQHGYCNAMISPLNCCHFIGSSDTCWNQNSCRASLKNGRTELKIVVRLHERHLK